MNLAFTLRICYMLWTKYVCNYTKQYNSVKTCDIKPVFSALYWVVLLWAWREINYIIIIRHLDSKMVAEIGKTCAYE